jgi:uracil-DNA glycosylase
VLLLNSALTVEDGQPQSHANRGWEALTDALLARVAAQPRSAVFMLWGASAQKKRGLVERDGANAHLAMQSNHPSPLSAARPPVPFVGCGHFSRANTFLASHRSESPAIRW